ncbi:hypothetical protein MNBD_ALPHA03-951 [hydrothermal vent metagenome]|uniref:VWFA domain-containing protein n=1 Tax=hydrothermal vent metagenome TaxID=652676 RepID=A0A3B1BIG9_9ZZZZ
MKMIREKIIQLMYCFKTFFLKLSSDVRGMSGVMLTMSIIPTIGVIGVATDVSRTYIVKTRLSTALDAAALAGGRNFFEADREAQIKKYFDANFPANFMGSDVTGPFELDAEGNQLQEGHIYSADDEVLRLTANVNVPTVFMNVFNFDNMTAGGDSEVTRETSLLDVVMAIDMSGSMLKDVNGNSTSNPDNKRIGLAKVAAADLVDILFGNNSVNALLNVGLVPWSGKVNVTTNGTEYGFSSPGVSLPAGSLFTTQAIIGAPDNPFQEEFYRFDKFGDEDIWDDDADLVLKNWSPQINNVYFAHNAPSVPLLAEPPTDWKGCVYARFARTRPYSDHQSYKDDLAEEQAGDIFDGPFEPIDGPAWVGWYPMGQEGEVSSCDLKKLNKSDNNCTKCPAFGITPLQNSKADIKAAVLELEIPSGSFYTNIPQGLAWAWRTITPGKPFDEATVVESSTYVKHKAIILLTDGTNTVRSGDAYNNGFHSRSRRDTRLKNLADAIKNKNDDDPDNDDEILIYTIQFANSNTSLVNLLKYVATDDDYYYHAPDKASLQNAFKKIAKELSNLRLSK